MVEPAVPRSLPWLLPPVPAATGSSYRQSLVELRRAARSLISRLSPHALRIALLLLVLCCFALLFPLPPLGSTREELAVTRNGSLSEVGEGGKAESETAGARLGEIEALLEDHRNKLQLLMDHHQQEIEEEERGQAQGAHSSTRPLHLESQTGSGEQEKRTGASQAPTSVEDLTEEAQGGQPLARQPPVPPVVCTAPPGSGAGAVAVGGWATTEEHEARINGANSLGGPMLWGPPAAGTPQRFLLLNCFRGQISKQLRCISNHLLLAGLLNRTLIVPPALPQPQASGRTFDLRIVADLPHIRTCLGPDVVVQSSEYCARTHSPSVALDLLLCWHGPQRACHDALKHGVKTIAMGWTCPAGLPLPGERVEPRDTAAGGSERGNRKVAVRLQPPFFTDPLVVVSETTPAAAACLPLRAPLRSLVEVYGAESAAVLAVGDLGEHQVADSPALDGRGGEQPFARRPDCPNGLVVSPHPALIRHAARLAASLFPHGAKFLSVHWQRRPFQEAECRYSSVRGRCMYGAQQAAACVVSAAQRLRVTSVYLTRGAHQSQLDDLKKAISHMSDGKVAVVQLEEASLATAVPWSEELPGVDVDAQWGLISNTLDKLVAAHASVFLASPAAAFSVDVQRLRYGLGLASCADSCICNGEPEWEQGSTT